MADPILTRRRVLAAKIETTPGEAIALAAADAAMNVFDLDLQADIEFLERQGQGAFSPIAGVPGPRGGKVTFACELCGSGSPGAPSPKWAAVFLPACGLVETAGVWALQSLPPGAAGSSTKTVTIAVYEDGRVRKLRGCMGTAVLVLAAGKIARIEFTMTGLWCDAADVAILAPTYPTVAPLRFADADLALDAWHPKVSEVRIDLGNEVVLREDAEDATGYQCAIITNRRITGSMDPEGVLVATDDHWVEWLDRTERVLAIALGGASATGNTLAIDAPKLQITNVQYGDRGGLGIDTVEFQLNRSASAGDDELVLTFA